MPGFSSFISSVFAPDIRSRGEQIVHSGRVRIRRGESMSAEALVQGSSIYHVQIEIREEGVYLSCSCPYYGEGLDPCKHIWAAVREAEGKGMLGGNGSPVAPAVILDDAELSLPAGWAPAAAAQNTTPAAVPGGSYDIPRWQQILSALGSVDRSASGSARGNGRRGSTVWPAGRTLSYRITLPEDRSVSTISIEIIAVDIKVGGEPGKMKPVVISGEHIPLVPDPIDRKILATLIGGRDVPARQTGGYGEFGYQEYRDLGQSIFTLQYGPAVELLPDICGSGRAYVQQRRWIEPKIVSWESRPLELWLVLSGNESEGWLATLQLRLDDLAFDRSELRMLFSNRMALVEGRMATVSPETPQEWLDLLRTSPLSIDTREEADRFIGTLLTIPWIPKLDLPEELRFEQIDGSPRPGVMIRQGRRRGAGGVPTLSGELRFLYEGTQVTSYDQRNALYLPETRTLARRNREEEERAAARLLAVGFRRRVDETTGEESFDLATKRLPAAVRALLADEWIVEAEGKLYRQSNGISLSVASHVDWFDLEGGASFDGIVVPLPRLLAALRRGEQTIALDDGTFGILPETWIARYARLARAGSDESDHIRFTRGQVGLLDALLAEQPDVTFDETFDRARRELLDFSGVDPVDPPATFVGTLREYQREALGWMLFLQRFGFGGCLADDMGLGKTPMALALLATRKQERDRAAADKALSAIPPALLVVPRTLVFNWMSEIERFTPTLRVINHTGLGRSKDTADFDAADVVITTYGTLRRDAVLFRDREFDYVILDEAQAIKNSSTESAKAARLLRGRHRLALSGTPIENHLGELWSLFEFLNPGMLGGINALGLGLSGARSPDEETRRILARALRPFILRRTKAQVAGDLPEKTEQTIWCELEPEQRRMYDELRIHYRESLLGRLDLEGIGRSKIQILEALLRLRQAACHPGLVDKRLVKGPSAKLDTLMEKVYEVIESGGKALVFSQFTSLLAIVRKRLDAEKISYEYLDGKTRDRQACVRNFQRDDGPSLFLISLKAGGVGLNLTAAEYVFLLDPWWNPAVEAQAIDRTHRIGQSKPVFAYRIVAADTVEEKILELQKTKRDLADAIVGAENSLIRQMTREDLELLLS